MENTSFGNIVYDILVLVERFICVSFSHVCREGNKVAHHLAQLSSLFCETKLWFDEAPREVQKFVSADLLEDE